VHQKPKQHQVGGVSSQDDIVPRWA